MICPNCGKGQMRPVYSEFYLYAAPSDYQCLTCYKLASEIGGQRLVEEIRTSEEIRAADVGL